MALVAEEMLLEHRHASDNAGLAACGESMELQIGGDERGGELSVCCGTGARAPDLRGNVVEFLAVLNGFRLALERLVLLKPVRGTKQSVH